MKRNRLFVSIILVLSVLLMVVATRPLGAGPLQNPSARAEVEAAWQRATELGVYHYTTEIAQTTWPKPLLENAGLSSTTERMYVEGETNAPAQTMQMKLWSGGGSAVTGDSAIQIRTEGSQAWGRVGNGEWEAMDNVGELFAPGSDPLGYLNGAQDITRLGAETRERASTHYSFKVNGPAFAAHMRNLMRDELLRRGELPPGLDLDTPRLYAGMTGEGEIWLDSHGLPLRQKIHIQFPPERSEQVEAEITTDFRFPDPDRRLASTRDASPLAGLGSQLFNLQTALNLSLLASVVSLVVLMALYRNSKKLYAALAVSLIVVMVVSPLLQSQQAYAFAQKQSAAREKSESDQEAQQALQARLDEWNEKDFDPSLDPLAVDKEQAGQETQGQDPSAVLRQSDGDSQIGTPQEDDGTDSDNDGLTDVQEIIVGTDPGVADSDGDSLPDGAEVFKLGLVPTAQDGGADSDGDGIDDGVEVHGFVDVSSKRWYLNPADMDTNGDGSLDGVECFVTGGTLDCPDTDGDGTADVMDFDDDDDGVPDKLDLDRTSAVGSLDGQQIAGLPDQTLQLELGDLQTGQPVFVDFQLRPANADHLWYTLNVLDWPSNDQEGQIQRVHDTAWGTSGQAANGDMRLIPMLEIEIPYQAGHYGNLPVRPDAPAIEPSTPVTAWLDVAQTNMFNISVRKKDNSGTLLAYVPVVLVEDQAGDTPVAFAARMFYRPSLAQAGPAQKVRLAWLLQAKTDTCTPPEGESWNDWCANLDHWVEKDAIIHSYYDDWYLTGLAVREDHGLKMSVILEDPEFSTQQEGYSADAHYEPYLWGLARGLDRTFIAGRGVDNTGDGQLDARDMTLADVKARFDKRVNGSVPDEQRWDIPQAALFVEELPDFPHQGYIAHVPMTYTGQILAQYYTDGSLVANPTLLFAREETFRTASLDTGGSVVQTSVTPQHGILATHQLKMVLNATEAPPIVLAGLNWAPYRYNAAAGAWEADVMSEYTAKLEGRLKPFFEQDPNSNADPSIVEGAMTVISSFYLSLYAGLVTTVEMMNKPLAQEYATVDADLSPARWYKDDEVLYGFGMGTYSKAMTGGSVAKLLVDEITQQCLFTSRWPALAQRLGQTVFGRAVNTVSSEMSKFLWATGQNKGGISGKAIQVFKGETFLGRAGKPLLAIGAVVAVGLAAYVLVALALDIPGTEYVIQGIAVTLGIVSLAVAIKTAKGAVDAGWQVIKGLSCITKAAAISAVVAFVVTAVVACAFFAYGMIEGKVAFGSLAFNQAVAGLVATLVVAAIMVAIGMIPIVGPIIVAVIGLIDALIATICLAAGLNKKDVWKDLFCPGITGLAAKFVELLIYDQNPIVDLSATGRLDMDDFAVAPADPTKGFAVGNRLSLSMDVITALYRNMPFEPDKMKKDVEKLIKDGDFDALKRLVDNFGPGILYVWQYADAFVNDSTFRYDLVLTKDDDEDVDIKEMQDEWQSAHRGGASGIFDSRRYTTTQRVNNGGNVRFTQAGLNWSPDLYLMENSSIQTQECVSDPALSWLYKVPIAVCWLRPTDAHTPIFLGGQFKFDVFPATLDEFYTLVSRGDNSYALAWDERFPTLADADGDGLRSQAAGGNDPDDRSPDMDDDGLSDFYEIQRGSNPGAPDTDHDGLGDYWEFFYHTDARRPDTDADGLWDKEEIDGWDFVYAFDTNNNPLVTRVTSDPNEADADGDGFTDKLEYVYGFHPRVFSNPDIMSIVSEISDSDGIVKPSDTIAYTATIENMLDNRYALGLLEVEFPAAVQNASVQPVVYTLPPNSSTTLQGQVTVRSDIAQSQHVSLTNRAGANIANLQGEAGGRVLWLHMEETGGETFADASLNEHTGSCSGTACPALGQPGYAGLAPRFDGVDDYVAADSVSANWDSNALSFGAWVYPEAGATGVGTVLAFNLSNGFERNCINYNPTSQKFEYYDMVINQSSANVFAPGAWHYVMVTLDSANSGVLYVDGRSEIVFTSGVRPSAGGRFSIGQKWNYSLMGPHTTDFFKGIIDEVEVLPVALSDTEVGARASEPSLKMSFDSYQDVVINSSTTERRYADAAGGAPATCIIQTIQIPLSDPIVINLCPAHDPAGKLGSALSLDTTSNILDRANAPDLSNGRFTQSVWIYPTNTGDAAKEDHPQGIMGYSSRHSPDREDIMDETNPDLSEYFEPNTSAYPSIMRIGRKIKVGFGTGTLWQSYTTPGDVLTLNAWNHVVAVYDGNNYTVYVNGANVGASQSFEGAVPYATTTMRIGRATHCATVRDRDLYCFNEQGGDAGDSNEFYGEFEEDETWEHGDVDNTERKDHDWIYNYCDSGELAVWEDDDNASDDVGDYTFRSTQPSTAWGNADTFWTQTFEGSNAGVTLDLNQINPSIPMSGKLDELAIYNRALSPQDVLDLYSSAQRAIEMRFDEAPGRTMFKDSSGNHRLGTCAGDACPDTGLAGRADQAARFDGVNDYVDVPVDVPETDYTLSLWFKTTCTDCGLFSVNDGTLGSGGHDRNVFLSDSNLCAHVWAATGDVETICTAGANYADGQWHNLAHVLGASVGGQKIYVDGVEKVSGTKTASNFSWQTGVLAGFSNNATHHYFNGLLDHVIVVEKALNPTEVVTLMNDVPIISLHLDDPLRDPDTGVTTTVFANVANPAGPGTCTTGCPKAGLESWVRQGAVFDGREDTKISVPHAESSAGSFTLGGWFRPAAQKNELQSLLRKQDCYELSIQANSLKVNWDVKSSGTAASRAPASILSTLSQQPLLPDYWNHLVATYDASTRRYTLYINGSRQVSETLAFPRNYNNYPIEIGSDLAGVADEVFVYNYVLPEKAIKEMFDYQVAWYDTTDTHDIIIDADNPSVALDYAGDYIPQRAGFVMAIAAHDQTSKVEHVEYSTESGQWLAASRDNDVWMFAITPTVPGALTIQTRATDSVGHTGQSSKSVTVDGAGPTVSLDSSLTGAVNNVTDTLHLFGTVSDADSGVASVSVTLLDGTGVAFGAQPATVAGATWTVEYVFAVAPNGRFSVRMEVADKMGNATSTSETIYLDGTAPYADLLGYSDIGPFGSVITGTGSTLHGTAGDMPYPTGQILHMHFEEAAGADRFYDGSPAHMAGTCSGAACPTAGVNGHHGHAVSLDGNDAVNLGPQNRVSELTSDFTLMAWVNLNSTTGAAQILSTDSPTQGLSLGVNSGGPRLDVHNVHVYTAPLTLETGRWTHLAATMARLNENDYAVTFYVDGVAQPVVTHTLPANANHTGSILVGSALNGLLDEVVVYDRALTGEQIQVIVDPGYSGLSQVEIGFLHIKDRDNPASIAWQPVTLAQAGAAFSTWSYVLPPNLEGPHKIYLRATDAFGHSFTWPNVWQGEIDTQLPRAVLTSFTPRFPGDRYIFGCWSEDYNLSGQDYDCPVPNSAAYYQDAAWYTDILSTPKLYRYESPLGLVANPASTEELQACDTYGACAVVPYTTTPLNWPLGVTIFTPTQYSVFTTHDPIAISGHAYAQSGLGNLILSANETGIYATGLSGTSQAWTTTYTPPADDAYTLLATLTDAASHVITSGAPISGNVGLYNVFYVDTVAPEITITTRYVNNTNFDQNGNVRVDGLVNEAVGVVRLQAKLNDGDWQDVPYTFTPGWSAWSVPLYSGSPIPPAGEPYTLMARVTDVANRTVTATKVLQADVTPPAGFDITLAFTDSIGARRVVAPGDTLYDVLSPTLQITWTAASDTSALSAYQVEWVEELSQTQKVLQTSHVSNPRLATFRAGEAQKLSVRITVSDTYGNRTTVTWGPVYVDYERTPLYVEADDAGGPNLAYHGWEAAPCNLIGTDDRIALKAQSGALLDKAQSMYAAWNGQGLRLTWTGANWSQDDSHLYIYLDTQPGGPVTALNPSAQYSRTVLLPTYRVNTTTYRMGADYVVQVHGNADVRLLEWDGANWLDGADLSYAFDYDQDLPRMDIYVPFSALGISDPANSLLGLVALATEPDAERVWATIPPGNPVSSQRVVDNWTPSQGLVLTHRHTWLELGAGVCPRQSGFAGSYVQASLTARPVQVLPGESAAQPGALVYSLLGNDLPSSLAADMATLIGWDELLEEPCLTHPEYVTCTQEVNTAHRVGFKRQAELAHLLNVNPPAWGPGRQVAYTLRLVNQGTAPASGVQAHIDTWGPLHLPGGVHHSDSLGEYDSIETTPTTLAAGQVHTITFAGQIDLAFDPTHNNGWGTLDVVILDDTTINTQDADGRDLYQYPLEWLYLDHEIDQAGPDHLDIQSPPHNVIGPGANTLGGIARDQSAIPTVTVQLSDTGSIRSTTACVDATPADGQWTCAIDVGDLDNDVEISLRTQAADVYGQVSNWFAWKQFAVDTLPPTVTLDSQVEGWLGDGWINPAEVDWSGRITDNRLPAAVEACEGSQACQESALTLDAGTEPAPIYVEDSQHTPINPGQTVEQCFTLSDASAVANIKVGLTIESQYRTYLQAFLVAPSGLTATLLHSAAGGTSYNYDVLLNDAAPDAITDDATHHTIAAPYYDNARRPYSPLNVFGGTPAQGQWCVRIKNTHPSQAATYWRSALTVSTNRPPVDGAGTWRYTLPNVSGVDGVTKTLALSGLDSVGNRGEELSRTFRLDTVAPELEVTSILTDGTIFYLSGSVSDGGGVKSLFLDIHAPDGSTQSSAITPSGNDWSYSGTPGNLQEGLYTLYVRAKDYAGNTRLAGPFEIDVVIPNVTVTEVEPADGAADVVRNATIAVHLSGAANVGTVNVDITPTIALTLTWNEQNTILTLRHALLAANTHYTVAVRSGSGQNGTPIENVPYAWDFTTGANIAPEADLALHKAQEGVGDVMAGESVTYTLVITNNGPLTQTTATLVDDFDSTDGLAAVQGNGCTWSEGSDVVTCTVSVSADNPTTVTLRVTTPATFAGLALRNTARVYVPAGVVDPNPGNDIAGPVIVGVTPRHFIYLPVVLKGF